MRKGRFHEKGLVSRGRPDSMRKAGFTRKPGFMRKVGFMRKGRFPDSVSVCVLLVAESAVAARY